MKKPSLRTTLSAALLPITIGSHAFAQTTNVEAAPETAAPASPSTAASPSAAETQPETSGSPTVSAAPEPTPSPEKAPEAAPTAPERAALPVDPGTQKKPVEETLAAEKPAPTLLPFTVGTSMFSRFEYRQNYDRLGVSTGRTIEGDATVFRARLSLKTATLALDENIGGYVVFTPQASGRWGTDGTVKDHALGIFEGYLHIGSDKFWAEAGRFAMDYGDGIVINNPVWRETGKAFDGVRARYTLGKGWIDGFMTQAAPGLTDSAEGQPAQTAPFHGDSYFWGAYAALGPNIAEKFELDGYVLGVTRASATNILSLPNDPTSPLVNRAGATELTFGARIKQTLGLLDYRLEGGVQTGARSTEGATPVAAEVFAYQVVGEAGFSFKKDLRVGLEAAVASGDDPTTAKNEAWDSLQGNTHRWLGMMDIIGVRTNIESLALRTSTPITSSLKLLVDGHIFARLEKTAIEAGDNSLAGYEIDTQLQQKIGGPAQVRALYGVFIPGKNHFATNDVAEFVEAEVNFTF